MVFIYSLSYTSDDENSSKSLLLALDKTFFKLLRNDSLKLYQLKILQIKMLKIKAAVHRCSVKKVFFKNFVKFTAKHLCQSLFFNKIAGFQRNSKMYFCNIFWLLKFYVRRDIWQNHQNHMSSILVLSKV